ncbi:D-2-hydroxyacid dehydrogenase [Gottschalkiaceae bacterium SANA]|nr:D-2-hydroxyacid dehydrogenase [Gottschalkiaceae bacterium SANA]
MHIVSYTGYYDPTPIREFLTAQPNVTFTICNSEDELMKEIPQAEVLITLPFTEELLAAAPKLKWVQCLRAGVDGYPFAAMKKRGLVLTNGKGLHRNHMAEYSIAMMILFARNLHVFQRQQSDSKWKRNIPQDEIFGKTVGILGFGAIGDTLATRAKAMGMRVLALKRNPIQASNVDQWYTPDQTNEFLSQADYLVNLLPNTPATHHALNADSFVAMKNSAVLISIGRGKTVDEQALIKALQTGQISGLAADVFETEPLPVESPLWQMENVVLTPHICGESVHYLEKGIEILEENFARFQDNPETLINQVNLNTGY